eukprot:Nk52_evm23s370 gene=Nk52_evmTU23s370
MGIRIRQLHALFFKNFALQKRQKITTLSQIIVPIFLLTTLYVVQSVIDHGYNSRLDSARAQFDPATLAVLKEIESIAIAEGLPFDLQEITFPHVLQAEKFYVKDVSWSVRCKNASSEKRNNECRTDGKLWNKPGNYSLFDAQIFLYTCDDLLRDEVGFMDYLGNKGGFLGKSYATQVNMTLGEGQGKDDWAMFPFFLKKSSERDMMDSGARISRSYSKYGLEGIGHLAEAFKHAYFVYPQSKSQERFVLDLVSNKQFENVKPHSGVNFKKFSTSGMEIEIIGMDEAYGWWFVVKQRRSEMLNLLSSAALRTKRKEVFGIDDDFSYSYQLKDNKWGFSNSIQSYIYPLDVTDGHPKLDISTFGGPFAFAFAASFLLPMFITNIVRDKEERHFITMRMSGLNPLCYWLISFLYDYTVYLLVISCVAGFSFLFQFRVFVQTSAAVLFILYALWGVAMIVLAFFLSTFFDKQRTAAVVGYLLVVGGVLTSNMVDHNMVFREDEFPTLWYMGYPPFAFYRNLMLIEHACARGACFTLSTLHLAHPFVYGLFCLGTSTLWILGLTIYLLNVTPHQFGIRKPYLFFLPSLGNLLTCGFWCYNSRRRLLDEEGFEEIPTNELQNNCAIDLLADGQSVEEGENLPPLPSQREDALVVLERQKVKTGELNERNCSVVIKDVVKIYKPRGSFVSFLKGITCGVCQSPSANKIPIAVKNVYLGIRKGECLGLLGANGAGKTTLISIITGLFEATSGSIEICGFDVNTKSSSIYSLIGVCPQFDILHSHLTVREHLMFYCRLKGLVDVRMQSDSLLKQVNLLDVGDRLTKDLSGGMRRRLSIAIAICGDPSVLVLDEPTTGLDPVSRRSVWEALEIIKRNRSVIITTHAMDEANRLCDRIAIMWKGQLKCLGSPTKLKNVYGKGFSLNIFFATEDDFIDDGTDTEDEDEVLLDLEEQTLGLERNVARARRNTIIQYVLTNFPGSTLTECHNDSCAFNIQKDKTDPAHIFKNLKADKDLLGIVDWGLRMCTMENVFLNVMRNEVNVYD